jgi:nitrate reductase molybdenum cofactor assembly chaperone NarJ/NarW
MQTYRILSALLCYPEQDFLDALPEFGPALDAEGLLAADIRTAIGDFITELSATDLLDAQERYVALFDRNRSLSLHLYEHVHGESRDRGQAMVRLNTLYQLHGLDVTSRELPDYLPLYLEFLSQMPDRAARSMLAEAVHVIAALRRKLEKRNSPYSVLLRAAESLAARPAQPAAVQQVMEALDGAADNPEALDREWEDEAVRFTANPNATAEGMAPACGS